jgi:hypothetical protein
LRCKSIADAIRQKSRVPNASATIIGGDAPVVLVQKTDRSIGIRHETVGTETVLSWPSALTANSALILPVRIEDPRDCAVLTLCVEYDHASIRKRRDGGDQSEGLPITRAANPRDLDSGTLRAPEIRCGDGDDRRVTAHRAIWARSLGANGGHKSNSEECRDRQPQVHAELHSIKWAT